MAKTYGVEYPERLLMGVLSDLLGIPHFTTARGSSVRTDFLRAVGQRLGVQGWQTLLKDDLLTAIIVEATGAPMAPGMLSTGGTVKNSTLQAIIDGLTVNWQPAAAHRTGARLPVYPAVLEEQDKQPDAPLGETADADESVAATTAPSTRPTGQAALDMPLEQLEDLLDPEHALDPTSRRLMALAYREGQDAFRTAVLAAYRQQDYEACCVTGHGPAQVLEAAHIVPHGEGGPSVVSNGLCLRSDIHELFDRGLLAFHETELTVLLHPVLLVTEEYKRLAGLKIHQPQRVADRAARAALKHRREAAGL